METKNLRIKK